MPSPRLSADARPAHRAGQSEDPRRSYPLPDASNGGAAPSSGGRAARGIPGLQRRVLRLRERLADAADLSAEAIRLGRLLVALLPEAEPVPEAVGLLALMLLQDSRRTARTSPEGELIPLEEQNRALWDRQQIAEGTALVRRALSSDRFGPYTIQAAIGAVHAQAPSVAATDWSQIVGLYDLLMRVVPSPVIELNRAVAVAMRDGPEAGLVLVDDLMGLVLPEPTKTPPWPGAALLLGEGAREQGIRLGARSPQPGQFHSRSARQGGRRGLRRTGLRGGASNRSGHANQPQVRARRPRPGKRLVAGLRHGQLRARLQSAAERHKRFLRPDPRIVRPRSRGSRTVCGGDGGVAARDARRDRGRGRDTRRLAETTGNADEPPTTGGACEQHRLSCRSCPHVNVLSSNLARQGPRTGAEIVQLDTRDRSSVVSVAAILRGRCEYVPDMLSL